MLEAGVEVRLETEVDDDGVVVAVDVCVDAVETLEDLGEAGAEGFGEGDAYSKKLVLVIVRVGEGRGRYRCARGRFARCRLWLAPRTLGVRRIRGRAFWWVFCIGLRLAISIRI